MAGREFGPPPSIITEFNQVWRNWLNLVFEKIYKRTYALNIQLITTQPHVSIGMTEGLLGDSTVYLADDTATEYSYFGFLLPLDWVPGTDLTLRITFINSTVQTGVKTVVTRIGYNVRALGSDVTGSPVTLTDTVSLPSAVAALTLHQGGALPIPGSALTLGDNLVCWIGRIATSDTCVGDVGYQNISIEYTGYINHE